MERVASKIQTHDDRRARWFNWKWVLLGVLVASPVGLASTGEDHYPESRFGSPPGRPGRQLEGQGGEGFASGEVARYDKASDDGMLSIPSQPGRGGTFRGPASTVPEPGQPDVGSLSRGVRTLGLSEASERPNHPAEMDQMASKRKGVQEIALIAGDLGFFPKTFFVSRDVPVRMYVTGASKHTLCIMMDSFQVRKQIRSQRIEEITFTPSQPGRYRFYCPVNGTEGLMVVREFAVSAASGATAMNE